MTRTRSPAIAIAVAQRSLHHLLTRPVLLLPPLLFPLFLFAAFAGGLSRITEIPQFDFSAGYTAFQFIFVLMQSAAMGGVFAGVAVAADFESGFGRRLFLATPHRWAIVAGYALGSLGRLVIIEAVTVTAALAVGMQVPGSGVDLLGLAGLTVLLNLAATLWATGVALHLRKSSAGPIMQMPVFLALFLAPVYVPLSLLSGWLHTVALANPVTQLLEAGRSLIDGRPTGIGLAFTVAAALIAATVLWVRRGLASAQAAAG